MSEFLNKYKVIIFGCLSAIALTVSELFKTGETNVKVLVFAGIVVALSFLANNLRGQIATIIGLVGTAVVTYVTMQTLGTITWAQIIIEFIVALLAVFTPPAKSRGYESSYAIQQAKVEGENKQPSSAGVVTS